MLCLSCHAIGGSGGTLGPDLTSIGASAQVDYLIESLLEPAKKIKEGYHTIIVTMKDGGMVTGVNIRSTDSEIIVRDAAGKEIAVAKSQIASKKMVPISFHDVLYN